MIAKYSACQYAYIMRKLFITAKYSSVEGDAQYMKNLYRVAVDAGWQPYCFAIERPKYDNQTQLWEDARSDIESCQGLMVDCTDQSMAGRMVEVGIAYERKIPIIVIKKSGAKHNILFDGVASKVVEYDSYDDITASLASL